MSDTAPTSRLQLSGHLDPQLHDVTLIVGETEFHCSKQTLAKQSPYFYSMFFKEFRERNQSVIELNIPGTADDFKVYLETIHALRTLNDQNVEGVIALSIFFQTGTATNRCVQFLMRGSKMKRKKRFQIAILFNLVELKKYVISDMHDNDDLYKLIPANSMDLDHATMGMILQRNLELQGLRKSSSGKDRRRRDGECEERNRRHALEDRRILLNLTQSCFDRATWIEMKQKIRNYKTYTRGERRKKRKKMLRNRGDSSSVSSSSDESISQYLYN